MIPYTVLIKRVQYFVLLREDIQKKNGIKSEKRTIWGEGVRKIIEFSSFTNDEKHGRGGVSE